MATKYTYIGHGDALYHVPARDLTDQDIAERAELWAEFGITEELLITSGLYSFAEPVDTKKKQYKKDSAHLGAAKDGE